MSDAESDASQERDEPGKNLYEKMIGRTIKIFLADEEDWVRAKVEDYDDGDGHHTIRYCDPPHVAEKVQLDDERWRFGGPVDDEADEASGEEESEGEEEPPGEDLGSASDESEGEEDEDFAPGEDGEESEGEEDEGEEDSGEEDSGEESEGEEDQHHNKKLKSQLAGKKRRIEVLELRVDHLEAENAELKAKNGDLQRQVQSRTERSQPAVEGASPSPEQEPERQRFALANMVPPGLARFPIGKSFKGTGFHFPHKIALHPKKSVREYIVDRRVKVTVIFNLFDLSPTFENPPGQPRVADEKMLEPVTGQARFRLKLVYDDTMEEVKPRDLSNGRTVLFEPSEDAISERMMSKGEVVWSFHFKINSRDTRPSDREFRFVCEYLNDPNMMARASSVPFRVISRVQKEKGAGAPNGGDEALRQAEQARANEAAGEAEGSVDTA